MPHERSEIAGSPAYSEGRIHSARSYLITRGPHEAPASGEGICNGTL